MSITPSYVSTVAILIVSLSTIHGLTLLGLSKEDKQAILDLHNEARNNVSGGSFASTIDGMLPNATNMQEMIWVCHHSTLFCLFVQHVSFWYIFSFYISTKTITSQKKPQPQYNKRTQHWKHGH